MTEQVKTDGSPTGNPYIDALINGGMWAHAPGGKTEITYAIRTGNESDGFHTWGNPWSETETAMLKSAFAAWESVANLRFSETDPDLADIWYWKGPDLPYDGIHDLPAYALNTPNTAIFCDNDRVWLEGLNPGGIGYATLLHEIGHGLGLAHPHDGGSAKDGTVFPGVESTTDFGDNDLNQSVYTIMSYNDGLKDNVNWSDLSRGFASTPMAFDIAAIQQIYGANMETRTGDDTYSLPVPTGPESYVGWSCIWDAGGNDTIDASYVVGVNAVIDLRDAPLVGEHEGGYISRIGTVLGGFTIANGVVIENAVGGWGDDDINGNEADNELHGLDGADTMRGFEGADRLYGYEGGDTLEGGAGGDSLFGDEGADTIDGGDGDDFAEDGDGNDTVTTGAGNDSVLGGAGDDVFDAGAGDDAVNGGIGADRISGGDGDDILIGDDTTGIESFALINKQSAGMGGSDSLDGGAGADRLYGMEGSDTLDGGDGNDDLDGGYGDDSLSGGAGNDTASGGIGNDTLAGSDGDDMLSGDDGKDLLNGNAGNDQLRGGAGDDTLNGADGNDTMSGGDGIDVLNGGTGDDDLSGGTAADTLSGLLGTDSLSGGDGNDILSGGMGADTLYGDAGADTLLGGFDNDTLFGGAGNDTLSGSFGNDVMNGGAGADRFLFSEAAGRANADTIAGFNAAEDKIVLSKMFFSKLAGGALDGKSLHVGTEAQNAKDFIIFDHDTGNLWYDADGRQPAIAQQLICTLEVGSFTGTLTAGNFEII